MCPLYSEDENHPTPPLKQDQIFFIKIYCASELEAHEIIAILVFTNYINID